MPEVHPDRLKKPTAFELSPEIRVQLSNKLTLAADAMIDAAEKLDLTKEEEKAAAKASASKDVGSVFLCLIIFFLSLPLQMALQGYAFARLWGMFAQPIFHVSLTWATAFGLVLLLRLAHGPVGWPTPKKQSSDDKHGWRWAFWAGQSQMWLWPLASLLIAKFWVWLAI